METVAFDFELFHVLPTCRHGNSKCLEHSKNKENVASDYDATKRVLNFVIFNF